MKNDVKDEIHNGTPKTLIPSDGVLNRGGVSKLGSRLEGDNVAHFLSWIKRLILQSSTWKYSYANDTIEGGL
jgi:hypothetical protein